MPQIELIRPTLLTPTGGSELTIANRGGGTVFYGQSPTVSSSNKTGSIASGETLSLTNGYVWVTAEENPVKTGSQKSAPQTPVILDLREKEFAAGAEAALLNLPAIFLSNYWTGAESADGSAAFQIAAEAAVSAKLPLILDRNVTLENTVTIQNAKEWKLYGGGYFGIGKIIDKCATGPCLRYELTVAEYNTGHTGRPIWRDVSIELVVDKEPGVNIVEWKRLNVIQSESSGCVIHGELHYANAGLYFENIADYAFRNWRMYRIKGHSWYYICPSVEEEPAYTEAFNGGNITFDNCYESGCTNGSYWLASGTVNNVEYCGYKANAEQGGKGAFYEKKESGEIAAGSETFTVASKAYESQYPATSKGKEEAEARAKEVFRRGGCAILTSGSGSELVHLTQTEEPYVFGTGEVKLRDKTRKLHKTDYRVLVCEPLIFTGPSSPMFNFVNCESEQRPWFLAESSGSFLHCDFQPTDRGNTAKAVMIWVAEATGIGASHWSIENCLYQKTESSAADKTTEESLVYGLRPSGGLASTVAVEWLQSTENQASQTNTAYKILDGDASYFEEVGHLVKNHGKGLELDTTTGDGTFRKIEGTSNVTLKPADAYVQVQTGSPAEVILYPLPNKIVTLVNVTGEGGGYNIVLKPGEYNGKEAGFNDEGETSGAMTLVHRGQASGNKKGKLLTLHFDASLEKWLVINKF